MKKKIKVILLIIGVLALLYGATFTALHIIDSKQPKLVTIGTVVIDPNDIIAIEYVQGKLGKLDSFVLVIYGKDKRLPSMIAIKKLESKTITILLKYKHIEWR